MAKTITQKKRQNVRLTFIITCCILMMLGNVLEFFVYPQLKHYRPYQVAWFALAGIILLDAFLRINNYLMEMYNEARGSRLFCMEFTASTFYRDSITGELTPVENSRNAYKFYHNIGKNDNDVKTLIAYAYTQYLDDHENPCNPAIEPITASYICQYIMEYTDYIACEDKDTMINYMRCLYLKKKRSWL